jgi:glycosyltransferase involved in cell wall biosynthesis
MPAYNSKETIKLSIESILNQTFKNFELIIIDDCSTDNTVQIINSFKDGRLKLICNSKNYGVSVSRNKGIKLSKGNVIAFCDSDDRWNHEKLEKQLPELENHDIICSDFILEKSKNLKSKIIREKKLIFYSDLLKYNFIANSSGIYNVTSLGKEYQKSIGAEDFLMWLNLAKRSKKPIFRYQEPLMTYSSSPNSLSANKLQSAHWRWKILINQLEINYLIAIYSMIYFFFKNLRKYFL